MRGVRWLLLAWLLACGTEHGGNPASDVRTLREETTPAGAHLVGTSPVTQNDWSVTASWDVESTMLWDQYTERVSERLVGFQRQSIDGDRVTFVRTLAGDTYSLRVERVAPGPPLRVRVSYLSSAS